MASACTDVARRDSTLSAPALILNFQFSIKKNMIYDKIENIGQYFGISSQLDEGLRFLQGLDATISEGRHDLSEGDYANVEVYTTKRVNEKGFEAHRRYIDIQYLIEGEERVLVHHLDELECSIPYDETRDVAFFIHDAEGAVDVTLGRGFFVVFFPEDAHEPQRCIGGPQQVKKVVVKVALD